MRDLDITTEVRRLEELGPRWFLVSVVTGVLGVAGAVTLALTRDQGLDRLLESYLVSFAFLLSLSLGALFFVLLQHATRAGWSVVVRRLAEAVAANIPLLALLAVPVVLGMHHLYHWSHRDAVAHDPILAGKSGYLNPTFFIVRLVLYFAVWGALALFLHRTSTAQDESGDARLTLRLERGSAPGLLLYAVTVNFAAFDLLMSLDPHWFSTIFGVYYFSGGVVGFFAVLAPLICWLQRNGRLRQAITVEHYHDVGKLLFAFTVFWAYIAFSQYMLIWYGNLPEETGWFLKRQQGGWGWVGLALVFGHFLIPFLVLVSRFVKRRPWLLRFAALWMLLMHWVDIYWLVMPEFSPADPGPRLIDLSCAIGLGGLFAAGLVWRLGRHSLVPEGDPRLAESLAFENG